MSKARILIVEDDSIIGMEIKDRVENLGYEVVDIVSYGDKAIESAKKQKPDLVLMDIHLKGSVDGIEAADAIRHEVDIPVVYLTAYADQHTIERAKITEAFGYVLKPFDERNLLSNIEMALYKHQMERKLKESERWLSITLNSIGEGLIATDVNGKINFMNPIAERLTGWRQRAALQKDLKDIFKIYEVDSEELVHNIFECIKVEATSDSAAELMLESKNKEQIPILLTASAIFDEKQQESGYVIVFHDDTERRNAREKLARQNRFNEFRAQLWKVVADKSLSEEAIIQKMLNLLGPVLGAQRVSYNKLLGKYFQESEFRCVLVWHNEQIKPLANFSLPGDLADFMIKENITKIDLDEKLPENAPAHYQMVKLHLEQFMNGGDIGTLVIVPFYLNDQLEAIISIDFFRSIPRKFRFDEDAQSLLNETIEIVTNYIIQRRNEEARRETEERLRAIFESAQDSIFIKDRFLTYTNINPAMEKLLKLSSNEVVGFTDEELFGPDIGAKTQREDLRVLKGETVNNEIELPIGKTLRTLNVIKAPMHDHSGKIVGICGIARDVTDRKRELQIRDVMYEISNAVNETRDLMEFFKSVQSLLGKIIDTKNFFIALYDAKAGTLSLPYHIDEKDKFTEIPVGKTLTRYVITTKKPLLVTENDIKSMVEKGEIELIGAMPKVWLGVPLISGGQVIGIIGLQNYEHESTFSKDHVNLLEFVSYQIATATERKRVEEERNRLATAIHHSADGIVITDENAKILFVNPAYEKTTGYSRNELIGQTPRLVKSGKQSKAFYQELWETITSGKIWKGHFVNRKKSGVEYTEEATISPILDERGKIVNFVAIKRDVTDELNMQARLRQAEKMEAIGTLAGGIAHDFNNIIAAIIGYAELSLDDVKDERVKRNLDEILSAGQRAKELVQQILAFSRKTDEKKKPLRIASIIKESMKLLRATIPSTIEIKTDIGSKDSYILGEPMQVHRIMMNLCTNAWHAMRENGGVLEVSVKDVEMDQVSVKQYQELKPGPYVKITVKDTGKGIEPEMIDRIFEPYFTTKEVGDGAGLGLALVHSIVKSYHGEIVVYSELGKGTTFNILLPKIKGPAKKERKVKKPLPKGNEAILFVDDEKNIATVGSQILRRLGYRVASATCGEEAIDIFRKNPDRFDLIITDQTMPRINGIELAKQILSIRSDIPIILCTGYSELVSKEKAKKLGIAEFLMKPLFSEELANVVRKVLDNHKNNKNYENIKAR